MDADPDTGRIHLQLTRSWPLTAGLLLLGWLWFGPLPEMARRAFSPHMMLHLALTIVVAPLLVIGLRRLRLRQDALPGRPMLAALGASAFEFVVVWGWHAPALHEAAAARSEIFVIQQISFLLAGMAVWSLSLASHGRQNLVIGAAAMLFTAMHMAMLGVLLVLAPSLLYAPQFCLGVFGLDPLADQQLGGGLMALFGASAYAAGGAWLALGASEAGP